MSNVWCLMSRLCRDLRYASIWCLMSGVPTMSGSTLRFDLKSPSLTLVERQFEVNKFLFSFYPDGDLVAWFIFFDSQEQVAVRFYLFAIDTGDDVAQVKITSAVSGSGYDTGCIGCAVFDHVEYQSAFFTEAIHHLLAGQFYAQRRPHHPSVFDQLRYYPTHDIHRDRKANARISSRRTVNGGIDADEPASGIQQGTTGITRIDRCIGLDSITDRQTGNRV